MKNVQTVELELAPILLVLAGLASAVCRFLHLSPNLHDPCRKKAQVAGMLQARCYSLRASGSGRKPAGILLFAALAQGPAWMNSWMKKKVGPRGVRGSIR